MRPITLRIILLGSLLALAAGPGAGSSPLPEDRARLTLTADAPIFETVEGTSGLVPRIPGFGLTSRPGEPSLPLKIFLVAIPEGSVPELVVLGSRSKVLAGVDLAPVPRMRVRERLANPRGAARLRRGGSAGTDTDILEYDREFARDERLFDRDADLPESPVRLGGTGYLREQRFVEVLFQPVQYNAKAHRARVSSLVRVEVRFAMPGGAAAERPFRPDPLFESTYAASLINYEQGKRFRVPAGEAAPETAAAMTAPAPLAASGIARAVPDSVKRYKIKVSTAGIFRLDYNYLNTNAPDLLAADPRTLVMSAEGVEIPIAIRDSITGASGEADGVFGTQDVLEFYGMPKGGPPTVLNYDFGNTFPNIYEANDFTDTEVYWLSAEGVAGTHKRIPDVSGAPGAPAKPLATDFQESVVWEENNIFIPLGAADPYFSLPSVSYGTTHAQRDLSVPLPGIAPVAATDSVTVRLRGGTSLAASPDHETRVWVNGDTGDAVDFTWDGEVIREQTFPVAQSVLTGTSTVHVLAPGLPGITVDAQYLDTVTVSYRRSFAAVSDVLSFSYPNQDARFQVGGMSGAAGVIYDIGRTLAGSDQPDAVRITGATVSGAPTVTYTFEVAQDASPGAPAVRKFIAAGPAGFKVPDGMDVAQDATLTTPGNAADILVIAARDTVDASPGGSLSNLMAHRLAAQGLTSRVVYIDQVYDEFSYGMRDANAVRSFLAYAYANWTGPGGTSAPPSFVLLVGDATPDYKNTMNIAGWIDEVPTPMMFQDNSIIGYYSSDNWTASFRGNDQIPDVFLGRISTRSAAASAQVFDKILRYETIPPSGAWKGRAILAAGDGKYTGESASFEGVNNALKTQYFTAAPMSTASPLMYFAEPPWNSADPTGFKNTLITEINNGGAVLTFVGHGSFDTWGLNTFFTATDAAALNNGGLLPFMLNVNCLAGGFHYFAASGSLAEGMVNNPNGGAIAAVAPGGLSDFDIGNTVAQGLFQPIFGPEKERVLGRAQLGFRTDLWSRGSIVDLQGYTFLGDPATVLVTPAPPPPTGLSAVAGNSMVTLSWSAPSQPAAGYAIYRATTSPTAAYAPVPCAPAGPTSCVDSGVVNMSTYYYYAVSLDAEGYPGRASNFNTDCDAGPDCVVARPSNPLPPSRPSGLVARDAGDGSRLSVSWTANPETDLKRYTLYYGILPGTYTQNVTTAPNVTSLILGGLTEGTRYYMALSATNTSNHESALSIEASAVPHRVEGIAPPRAISNLMVNRSGADLVLTWSQPTVDIYGRPTTVAGYRVYRGTTPGFQPFTGPPFATIGSGSTTTFTDPGAGSSPGNLYYLVVAVDAAGLVSGASHDLPHGVADLTVTPAAGTTVHLAWSPVTTDVQGLPTVVAHYLVYVSSVKSDVARATLNPAALALDNGTSVSVDFDLPGNSRFVSIIVVDNRGNLSPF